jgi:5-formyltetrahydrofolate cyclo-ligase
MSETKAAVRRTLLAARRQLHDHQRLHLDRRICVHVLRYLDDLDALGIAAFHPFGGEPDLRPALNALHHAARRVHLPVLEGEQLNFRRWTPEARMETNRFGIPEPVDGAACPLESLDVVFMPLVAFTAKGARLGMGGGFYDRTFAELLHQPGSGPLRVGVAYNFQQADSLPIEPWDVPVDAVITDRGCLVIRD